MLAERPMSRPCVLPLLLVLLTACPTPQRGPVEGPPIPAGAGAFGALELVPPNVSYLLAVRRLSTLSEALRGFVEPLRVINSNLTIERVDQEIRRELGASFLDANELDDGGFDLSGDVALYATDASPTLIARVVDETRLSKFLADRTKSVTTYIKPYKNLVVTSWVQSPEVRGTYVRIGRYFVLRYSLLGEPAKQEKPPSEAPHPWLDEILAVQQSRRSALSGEALRWVLDQIKEDRDAVLFVDGPRLAQGLKALTAKTAPTCGAAHDELAQLRRLAAGFRLQKREMRARVIVDLSPEAQKDLRQQMVRGAILPAKLRDRAGLRLDWQLKPPFLPALVARLGKKECGPAAKVIAFLGGWTDLLRHPVAVRLGGGISAAILESDERGQGTIHLRAAAIGGCDDQQRRALARDLPGDGKETVAGKEVQRVTTTTVLTERVRLALSDGLLRLAAGDGLMEQLLAKPPTAGDSMVSLRLEPGRLADVRAALKVFDAPPPPATPWGYRPRSRNDDLDQLAHVISAYALLRIEARAVASGVQIDAEYRLR
jgi:hypothetical protein